MLAFNEKNTTTALRLIAVDYALFLAGVGLVAAPTHWLVKLVASLLLSVSIARLFVIGHDACHQSLTAHRRWNRWLGRLVFLPSLTPFTLWELGHNMVHHSFTNLRGRDYVWAPLSPTEFTQMSRARQLLERYYRSGSGHWLYYLLELWWKKMYFPTSSQLGGHRRFFIGDCLVVSAFGLAWIGMLIAVAYDTQQSAWLLVTLGFILPFLLWNEWMGFTIYVHHTDPEVRWYHESTVWTKSHPHLTGTIHIQFPEVFGTLFHHIMEHPAHHLDMTIPLYQLKAAQRQLDALVPGQIVKREFSWRGYWHCVRHCKLYDYEAGQWVGFPDHLK